MYTTFTPKNRQIAEMLSRKLDSNPNQSSFKEQFIQSRALDEKYKSTIQKLKMMKIRNQIQFDQLRKYFDTIDDSLYGFSYSKNKTNDLLIQLSQNFEKFAQGEQVANTQKMGVVRKGMIEDIDKKKKAMKVDAIDVIQSEFQQTCKTNLSDIEKKINIIVNLLQEQRNGKQQSASYLARTIGQQILKMEEMIAHERQQRKTKNEQLLELIGQIQDKMEQQLIDQNKQRQKAESIIQQKLEEVCNKIQLKILGSN